MSQRKFNASIVAVGTEVSTGEVINGNAQWLAEQLCNLHFNIVRHVVVPDDVNLILESLDLADKDSALIVVTGGLGPTTDDFTRNVVAQWTDDPLLFDDASWQRIVTRLSALGVTVAESNKQQCYFPRSAQILENPAGTANAFMLKSLKSDTVILCLPGPPAEIKAVWESCACEKIEVLAPAKQIQKLWYWHCLGISESQLGEIVEMALAGSGYVTGYRPNVPYVDVKVWAPAHKDPAHDPFFQKLESAIAQYTVSRNGEDIVRTYLERMSDRSLLFVDELTNGVLAARIGRACMALRQKNKYLPRVCIETIIGKASAQQNPSDLCIQLRATNEPGTALLTVQAQQNQKSYTLKYPRRMTPDAVDRFHRYIVEIGFINLLQER